MKIFFFFFFNVNRLFMINPDLNPHTASHTGKYKQLCTHYHQKKTHLRNKKTCYKESNSVVRLQITKESNSVVRLQITMYAYNHFTLQKYQMISTHTIQPNDINFYTSTNFIALFQIRHGVACVYSFWRIKTHPSNLTMKTIFFLFV